MTDNKILDHIYHRTRIDAQISGNIGLVVLMAVLALTIGDKFKPFQLGADWLEPVRLVWVEQESGWVTEQKLVTFDNFPPATNKGPVEIREIYPISLSIMVVLGVAAVAYFIYRAARRQTRLLSSVYASEPSHPYERPWEDIRVTFWATDATLAFIMFFFLT